MENKGYTLSDLQGPFVAYRNIYFVGATDVLLISFLSEDLVVPPHELLKCGISLA